MASQDKDILLEGHPSIVVAIEEKGKNYDIAIPTLDKPSMIETIYIYIYIYMYIYELGSVDTMCQRIC
jgi:hypothetical protein